MQVRIDTDLAVILRRKAKDYERAFKRRKSLALVTNEALRSALYPRPAAKKP